ncbi:DNA topoisomerase I [Desulfobotulus alkaliphilus]|uniref:DNA topoisomerase 1 n=1 Tax=Desulfobotulus alkaliphilus TaxID=622671 RepID=A0A562S7R4_9BACT|nr:type I DNA topoisomerase [Desulfobotulus alkaliphilus]TWI77481.1 DNA topoisomerase I [Desulfobotulus alkaliphilus]
MSKPLVIVESPTKVRTLKKYIGDTFNVTATSGHIRDLPPKEIGIDIENGFTPQYQNIKGKQNIIKSLKAAAENASDIYLAPDPDREGEAIAFHTADILKKKGRRFHRVLFHELTKNGIEEALKKPSELNVSRYDAQQARRILDRLVGYQISPLLWKKVQGGLSAGRVQSVAVRIICDRERQIQAFEPKEYWSITAGLESPGNPPAFEAKLSRKNNEKCAIPDASASQAILKDLEKAAFTVEKVVKKTTKRNPLPPFTTSKLQQEAIRKLRFSAQKTMIVAQQLYEGLDLGPGEPVGLITYMRTDSTRIANEAAHEALDYVRSTLGPDFVAKGPRAFENRKKVQDAHEAIRPTSVGHTPESIRRFLDKDQFALYELIWKRFVASQMSEALIHQVSVSIAAGIYTFSVSGSTVAFPGFMQLYTAAEEGGEKEEKKQNLPDLKEGEKLDCSSLVPRQHFTQPPPRFSEASLVKELEENGIGRPSTYASILSTIRNKGYVEMVNRYFRPSELGFIVNDLLVENFPEILDVDFTARLENDLDRIEGAEVAALQLLQEFYTPFSEKLDAAKNGMQSIKGVGIPTDMECPECKKGKLHVKVGKNGPFIACSAYPDCHFSRNYERNEKGQIQLVEFEADIAEGQLCDKCQRPMVVKQGRFGTFLACSGYPECKNTSSIHAGQPQGGGEGTGVACPEEGCSGELVERKSRRGKVFYGCKRYPDCTFAIWDKPIAEKCPDCGHPYLVEKTTKKLGTHLKCPAAGCNFTRSPDEKE